MNVFSWQASKQLSVESTSLSKYLEYAGKLILQVDLKNYFRISPKLILY